jgi:hypothetical protein
MRVPRKEHPWPTAQGLEFYYRREARGSYSVGLLMKPQTVEHDYSHQSPAGRTVGAFGRGTQQQALVVLHHKETTTVRT